MSKTCRDILSENGLDAKTTMERFMDNEELYKKFCGKLKDDKTFEHLQKSYKDKDFEEAFKDAHTMKGVLLNLGLISNDCALMTLVEQLRRHYNYEESDIEAVNEKFKEEYKKVLQLVDKIAGV